MIFGRIYSPSGQRKGLKSATQTIGQPPTRRVVSNVIKGRLGNLIEWFDWFVYASFSIYFAAAFFPSESPTAQLLAAASIFSIGGTLVTVPVLTLLSHTDNAFAAFGLMMVGLVFVGGYTALSAIVKAEMFPTNVRALGVGLPHAIVAALFGGTAEPIALALKQAGSESMFFWYVTGCIAITFFAALTVKDPSKNSQLETIYAPASESETPDAPGTAATVPASRDRHDSLVR